jgi:hypothetical protein
VNKRIAVDRAFVVTGAAAGLIAGVILELYLLVTVVGIERVPIAQFYQYIASGAVGPAAFGSTSYALLGVALHFAVSIMWGIGYAYATTTVSHLNMRPITSGAVFGFIVLMAMNLVEVGANIFRLPRNNFELFNLFISHMIFFGIPLAWIVASRTKRALAA